MGCDVKEAKLRQAKAEAWDEGYQAGYVDGLNEVIRMLVDLGDNYAKMGSAIDSMLEPDHRHHYQEALIRNQYNAQALCLKLEADIKNEALFPLDESEQEEAEDED